MTTVLLVDDQALLRLGFRMILEAEDDLDVVGEAGDGRTGVSMAEALAPDVVLMDVRMPGLDGIAATAQIVARRPETRVLILTTFDLDEYVYEAPTATRRLLDQFSPMLPSLDGSEPQATDSLAALTDREREVFVLIAEGRSNREIAQELYVSEGTVKIHVGRVFAKLGVRDRVQAVVLAYETGVVRPGSSSRPA